MKASFDNTEDAFLLLSPKEMNPVGYAHDASPVGRTFVYPPKNPDRHHQLSIPWLIKM